MKGVISISEALSELILPQVEYPNPDQLEEIQAELDKQWPQTHEYSRRHVIRTSATVVAEMKDEQINFLVHFWLYVDEGGDWVIDRVLPKIESRFQGPFVINPQLDKPIIAIRKVFGCDLYLCLEEEKETEENRAMERIRQERVRVKNAFREVTIINLATVPTA